MIRVNLSRLFLEHLFQNTHLKHANSPSGNYNAAAYQDTKHSKCRNDVGTPAEAPTNKAPSNNTQSESGPIKQKILQPGHLFGKFSDIMNRLSSGALRSAPVFNAVIFPDSPRNTLMSFRLDRPKTCTLGRPIPWRTSSYVI